MAEIRCFLLQTPDRPLISSPVFLKHHSYNLTSFYFVLVALQPTDSAALAPELLAATGYVTTICFHFYGLLHSANATLALALSIK